MGFWTNGHSSSHSNLALYNEQKRFIADLHRADLQRTEPPHKKQCVLSVYCGSPHSQTHGGSSAMNGNTPFSAP